MDKKQFAQEYRKMQAQNTPDLWNRIEAGLEGSPDRKPETAGHKRKAFRHSRTYGLSAAAALVLLVMGVRLSGTGKSTASLEQTKHAVAMQEETVADEIMAWEAEIAAGDHMAETTEAAADGSMAGAAKNASETITARPVNALQVPADAITVPYDTRYFSEAVLAETELLCEASVTSAAFGEDESGWTDHVVYEVVIDAVYYAEGYVSEKETVEVTSPIVQADADEAYLLYQLKPGATYLLPLRTAAGGWELIYPFAPQIEVAADQEYVFHTGYSSLINQNTLVMKGEKQGENDFYYDRMLVREDDNFLSDLISLIKHEVQGRK